MSTALYRSRKEKMVMGVCGGLGAYLGIDPTFVRLFFVLLTLGNGIGFFLYVVLAILMPLNPDADAVAAPQAPFWDNDRAVKLVGMALVVIGLFAFLPNISPEYLGWINLSMLWPALMILGGAALLVRALRQGRAE